MKKISAILLALVLVLSMTVAMAQTVGTAAADTATITISNAAKGHTYKVAKLFNATVTGTEGGSIAYTGTIPEALSAYFTADSAGNISATAALDLTDPDVQAALKTWAEANVTAQAESDGSELEFVGLDYGYYIVVTTQGEALLTVASTNPNAEIIDKNSSDPIIPNNAKTVEGNEVDYQIGDTATFTITFTATNYDADNNVIEKYVVKDTPVGLEIDPDSVVVKVGDANITTSVKAVSSIEKTGMTLNIAWATKTEEDGNVSYTSLYDSPSTVTITYDAVVVALEGSNKAEISYNEGEPVESEINVKTSWFALVKTDENGKVLAGAKFELYDAEEEGNKIALVKESDGVYRVATPAEQDADFVSAIIEAGNVVIKGLDKENTYYLDEIEAPAGYNKLTARVEVKMGTVAEGAAQVNDDGTYSAGGVQVKNSTGSELPSTGGMGTTIFYVVGSLMMAAAIILLASKKIVASGK